MLNCLKSHRILLLNLVAILFAICLPGLGYAQEKVLTIGYPAEKNDFHDAAAGIIRAAYDKLGVSVKYKTFPAERSLIMSNDGKSDGELVRISGLSKKYPNLIQIPFSHAVVEQMAFSVQAGLKITGWDSLASLKIAFDRGFKVAERNTKGMNAHSVSSHEAAFRMVKIGRMDVAVANRFTGARILRKPEFKTVLMIEPPLQASQLYHYLHVRHEHLIEPLVKILNEMSTSGEIGMIKKRFNLN